MNMSDDPPLRNAPLNGMLLGADQETIARELARELRDEGKEPRVSGNFGLADRLDDAFLKRERCIFGFASKE